MDKEEVVAQIRTCLINLTEDNKTTMSNSMRDSHRSSSLSHTPHLNIIQMSIQGKHANSSTTMIKSCPKKDKIEGL